MLRWPSWRRLQKVNTGIINVIKKKLRFRLALRQPTDDQPGEDNDLVADISLGPLRESGDLTGRPVQV